MEELDGNDLWLQRLREKELTALRMTLESSRQESTHRYALLIRASNGWSIVEINCEGRHGDVLAWCEKSLKHPYIFDDERHEKTLLGAFEDKADATLFKTFWG